MKKSFEESGLNHKRIIFKKSEEPLQPLFFECDMLITDYSSVAWDFLYLNKPTIFYQFDYDKYMKERGSYLNMKKELFGPLFTSATSCIEFLTSEAFPVNLVSYLKKKQDYFSYHDNRNSFRVYNEIIQRQEIK